jgi:hypothetical protein
MNVAFSPEVVTLLTPGEREAFAEQMRQGCLTDAIATLPVYPANTDVPGAEMIRIKLKQGAFLITRLHDEGKVIAYVFTDRKEVQDGQWRSYIPPKLK